MAVPLHRVVLKVLTEHDPLGICADNPDCENEYADEARQICSRMVERAARSGHEITAICHAVFFESFGEMAGPAEDYSLIAGAVLAAL